MAELDFNKIAAKWQKKWEEAAVFKVSEEPKKPKFYCLEMFPYPSGTLHMGHMRNYSIGDCYARYKRMRGFNVLYPMGYDAFGLPAENAAIKNKVDPQKWTEDNMRLMKHQQKLLGLSYDWDRELATCYLEYYKWNQWVFLKMFEKGLAYKKLAAANWCPSCKTVLANEQVHEGKCWRCHSQVELKKLEQWFLKITEYADQLLNDLDKLGNWPERVKVMQRNWIGRSEGLEEHWPVDGMDLKLATFTTWPHTTYGATFMVIAPEHPLVEKLVKGTQYEKGAKEFVNEVLREKLADRANPEKGKKGFFTGRYAINHLTGWKMPIYIANFAIMEYGTGIVKCTPTHDQRDFEFAKKYNLPMQLVIKPKGSELKVEEMTEAYVGEGVMINAGQFTGMETEQAKKAIADYIVKQGNGKYVVQYKLRDWLISRQRYWGTPIPIIYCKKCGIVPVPEKDLPVVLPDADKVEFTGEGNPLDNCEEFVNAKCPNCGSQAKRETDTMDTFVDSSWYFLRYCSPHESKKPFDRKAADYWMPVDQYIGGIEHAVMHLLYARFFIKVLKDLGLVNVAEPFSNLLCQGMVLKDGAVMSKSRGNVVDPRVIVDKYGPDTARLFILSIASPEKELEWSDKGVEGSFRLLKRIFTIVTEKPKHRASATHIDKYVRSRVHSTVKEVTEHFELLQLNMAVTEIVELVNVIADYEEDSVNKAVFEEAVEKLVFMTAPFAPHLAEEMWHMLGKSGFVSMHKWPEYEEEKIDLEAEEMHDLAEKTAADIDTVLSLARIAQPKKITVIAAPKWKFELFRILKRELQRTRDQRALINTLIAEKDIRPYASEVAKIAQMILKDAGKMPKVLLSREKEFEAYSALKEKIVKKRNAKAEVLVTSAEDTAEKKAAQAFPGKPAIVVE